MNDDPTLNGPSAEDTGETAPAQERDPRSPEEIQAEIEDTRRELGESLGALGDKLDLKARARAQAADVKHRARSRADTTRSQTQRLLSEHRREVTVAVALTTVSVVVIAWRRRRR